jgi:hypothetical protein
MADEVKKEDPILNESLKTLVGESPVKLSIIDYDGKEHFLAPLTVNDMLEFERRLGVSLYEAASRKLMLSHITTILWLSMRKAGLSREEIVKKKFKISYEEFGEMFDASFILDGTVTTIGKLLEVSGLKQKNPPMLANSTEKPGKSDTTNADANKPPAQ